MKNNIEKKKIVFLTGTRADFGKLKPLINVVEKSDFLKCFVFVTGMHILPKYGYTFNEVKKQRYKNIFAYANQEDTVDMDIILANTIKGFSYFVKKVNPDMIIVHGDRVESLAGAIVGSLNNILVSHIEGGEISGTVDELIRHAVSKLSHLHFVANIKSKERLIQMGEAKEKIFVIGSPDIDIMKAQNLPKIDESKKDYEIPFNEYSIFIYHPVVDGKDALERDIRRIISALIESNKNYIVIYPNNDTGSNVIINKYKKLQENRKFKVFPSLRFEHFLILLKNSKFIIGNSSSGIREAEVYGIPVINIGTRQKNRTKNENIINVDVDKKEIFKAINKVQKRKFRIINNFGKGNSAEKFYAIISSKNFWNTNTQKQFLDLED